MEDSNLVFKKDSLEGYEFVKEEAHRNLFFIFNRITDSQDELRDLIHYLKHDYYSKRLFQESDLQPFIDKMDGLLEQIDTLYNDSADIFKSKGLLVKEA